MRAALLALLLPLAGCGGMMQSMMTKSVDQTAGARVLAHSGEHEVKRLDKKGNTFPVSLKVGESLKTADLIIGSDDEQSMLLLMLSESNLAQFNEADFVLRSPLGEDTDVFMATIEMGRVLLSLKGSPKAQFNFVDTNKSTLTVHASAVLFMNIDDDGMRVFVKSGAAEITNSASKLEVKVAAGSGQQINEGKATPWSAPADLNWGLEVPSADAVKDAAKAAVGVTP